MEIISRCRHEIYSEWLETPADCCFDFCDNCRHWEDVEKMLKRFSEFKMRKQLKNLRQNPSAEINSKDVNKKKFKFLEAVKELPVSHRPCLNVYTVFGIKGVMKRIPVRWVKYFYNF